MSIEVLHVLLLVFIIVVVLLFYNKARSDVAFCG